MKTFKLYPHKIKKCCFANVTYALQGILFAELQTLDESCDLALLWLHESCRVYSDRLVDVTDMQLFRKLQMETAHECFEVQCTI